MNDSSNECYQESITEFLSNISFLNSSNVNQINSASSYFRFLITNPNNLNFILSIIDMNDISENAYLFASIILQEKIRQPIFQTIQQSSDKIYELLLKIIFKHQNLYRHAYYQSFVKTYVDFIVVSNNLSPLPEQINHPIQCLYYSQLIDAFNSTYIFSFFTDNQIMTQMENASTLGKEYITSLSNVPIEQKVNQEWILLIKSLLRNDFDILDNEIILETMEYSIQKRERDFCNELNDLFCVILNNYSFLPSPDSSFLSDESFFFYPTILKNSFLFSDILINENFDTLFLNLWTDLIQFPIVEIIQSFDQESVQIFTLFLTSLSKAINIFESASIFCVVDIIVKFPSMFECINDDFLNLQITTDFFNNIIHHLIDLLSNPSLWNCLDEVLSCIYRFVPNLFVSIIADSQPVSGLFYICSVLKNLPIEIITVLLQKLFSIDSFPSSGLLFIIANLSLVLNECPNELSRLFVIENDHVFCSFVSLLLKNIIIKVNSDNLNFNIFDQKINNFVNKAVSFNSISFNFDCFCNCLVSLVLMSLQVDDDSSRTQFYQQIRKSLVDFFQYIVNANYSNDEIDDFYSKFVNDVLIGIGQIKSKYVDEAYSLIVSAINESADDKLMSTLSYESQRVAISLINSILNEKLFQYFSKEAVSKILNWIMNSLANNCLITGYIDILVSLLHFQVLPPKIFMFDFLYHMSVLNNEACEMVFCCACYLFKIIKCVDIEIWHFFPPSFLVALSCSHYQLTNEILLKIISMLIEKNSEIPNEYGSAMCTALIIVFFNLESKSLVDAAEIVSLICLRGGSNQIQDLLLKMGESAHDLKPLVESLYGALNVFFGCKSEGKLCLMKFESQLKFFLIDHFELFQYALKAWCNVFYVEKK